MKHIGPALARRADCLDGASRHRRMDAASHRRPCSACMRVRHAGDGQARLLRSPGRGSAARATPTSRPRSASSRCSIIPDRNPGDKDCEHRFKEINEAYEVLKDGDKRAAYDRFGHAAFEQGGGGGARLRRRFRLHLLRHFRRHVRHGRRARGRGSGRERGADLRYNMEITLEEAFGGKTAQIRMPTSVTCEACSGTGAKAGTKPKTCATCGGHGKVRHAQGFFTLERTCPTCHGRGQVIDNPCAVLLRLRPRDARAHAVGQYSGRRRGRHAHPARRRRRGRRARRAGRRPLHLPVARARTRSSSATAPTCIAACRSRW